MIVGQNLAHIDFLDEAIERLSVEIEEQIAPFAKPRELLVTIPGIRQRAAEVLISEIGVDMSIFPTPKRLASWAKVSPGNDQSAGKRRSGKTGEGNKWLRATLNESATAAARTKDTYLAAQYQRLRGRRGHSKAVTAVGHSIPPPPGTCSKPGNCSATWAIAAARFSVRFTGPTEGSRRLPGRKGTRQEKSRRRRHAARRRSAWVHAIGLDLDDVVMHEAADLLGEACRTICYERESVRFRPAI